MAYVVTEACIRCKYTDCVSVCPVDCFHEGPNFLVIDPAACIDCAVCVPECPVNAIAAAEDLPPEQRHFIELNARLAAQWPVIAAAQAPLPDAEQWANVPHKLDQLDAAAAAA
jgi:ferredoxin